MRKEEKEIEESLKIRCVICADSVLAGDSMYFKGQKGLAHADLAKKLFLHGFLLFYVRLLRSFNFCFGPFELRQFKNNCSGLKDLSRLQLFTECVYKHHCFILSSSLLFLCG